jgi:galactose mutarotase-like enzyme
MSVEAQNSPAIPFGSAELRMGGSRVVIVPALGGKIAALELAGRQWLWTNDLIPYRPPRDGASYVETADTGGYDECFPTVGACKLPTSARSYAGLALPDHGELWAQAVSFTIETGADGTSATCEWTGRRMPYRFTRVVRVLASGAVEMRYAVANEGSEQMPFVWSAHPLLPLTPQTRLLLPEGARVRVYAEHSIDLFGMCAEHRWPHFRLERGIVNMSHPASVARAYACKLFFDMPVGRAAVDEGNARLEVTFDIAEVPNLGLWINRRGWTPFERKKAYLNLGLEPCIGAPDTLSEALGAWRAAHWLEPGQTRQWSLTWRAVPIAETAAGSA